MDSGIERLNELVKGVAVHIANRNLFLADEHAVFLHRIDLVNIDNKGFMYPDKIRFG